MKLDQPWRLRLLAVMTMGVSLALASAPASAEVGEELGAGAIATKKRLQPKKVEEARTHYANGMKFFDEGRLKEAREQFEKAYELAPSFKLLYNLGLAQKDSDPARVVHTFEAYLAQGAWEIPDDRVTEVTKIVADLNTKVAHAKVASNVPGVQIMVDNRFVGQTPLDDVIALNPGPHRLMGQLEGRVPEAKDVTVMVGEVISVQLDLKEALTGLNPTKLAAIGALVLVAALGALIFRRLSGKADAPSTGDAPPTR